ncbi:alpha/beta fold hydrolase [Calothrix sp. 336/3]|uniref:alpha/beta fold hydrolase n=1 Tax=Calothrix sp. 336/3 TaxID=1337936 RepID=UPI0004E40BD9|nr:alpha/beta hydrolase [Calothrix sp. 336/3]AKG24342.1 hypothetical protein IJ00_26185 [Calothrix sp. 336/3]
MSNFDVLWLTASPSLKRFDLPLLRYLSTKQTVAHWEYIQSEDEASSIYQAVDLLHDFLKSSPQPVHLAGHGISGAIALLFARRYPEMVRSLSLLAVASQPANTWQAHYYTQRQIFTTSQEQILANNVRSLFGNNRPYTIETLSIALKRDLELSPCQHSLFRLIHLPKGGVSMPLLVCGSKTDPVVSSPTLHDWTNWFKPQDTLWECPGGYHFFHYFHPQEVGQKMLNFWRTQNQNLLTNSLAKC